MLGEKHSRDSKPNPASYLQRFTKGKKGDKREDRQNKHTKHLKNKGVQKSNDSRYCAIIQRGKKRTCLNVKPHKNISDSINFNKLTR